jgi:predicted AAA+ superfamily ATPase
VSTNLGKISQTSRRTNINVTPYDQCDTLTHFYHSYNQTVGQIVRGTIGLVDPSIATAALGLGPTDLMNDLNSMGFFFEAMCVRDLRVFAEALNGKVYHYRDKSGLECDAVIHLRNGQYGLIEIKLGGDSLIKEGAETLNELANQIDTTRMKSPAFKMILTATGEYAYRRPEDGIYVVPIGCLRP